MTEKFPDFLTLIYSLKPPRKQPKLYIDFAASPGWRFLYGFHLYKGLCAFIQVEEKIKRTVTGSVRIPSLIFTLFCFSFFCLFDLQIKSEIQKLAKSSLPSYSVQDLVTFSNVLASWFIPGHWWLSDSFRYWMDFAGVMLGLYMFLLCHSLSQFFFLLMKNSCISWHQAIKNHVLGVLGHRWPKGARETTAEHTTLFKRNSSKQTELALCPSQLRSREGQTD